MGKITFEKVVGHLEKMKAIYETLHLSKREIQEIQQTIETFTSYGDISIDSLKEQQAPPTKKKTKLAFKEVVELLFQKRFDEISGTKLDFGGLKTSDDVIGYIEKTSKTKIMKETTVLDLKLLYSLLTCEKVEVKGTKNDVFEAIKSHIRARKRGKAFSTMV